METKKKIGRFTYVDCCIIILVIAVLAAAWLFLTKDKYLDNSTILYTVNIQNLEKEVADQIKEGSQLFDGSKNYDIGKIVSVEKKPFVEQSLNTLEGKYIESQVPERYEVTITVESKGHMSEERISIGDYELYTGKTVYLKSAGFVATGTLWEIKEVKNND